MTITQTSTARRIQPGETDGPAGQIESILIGPLCDECALIVANDDASGVEQEREDDIRASIGAIQHDEGGRLVITDPRDGRCPLYRCACCADDAMGTGWVGEVLRQ